MSIKLKGSTSGSVELDVPAAVSGGDIALTLPTSVGSANQFLKNNGTAGTLEFASLASSNMPTGSILQVVQTIKSNQFSTSATTYTDVTGLSATITPSATSNKILVRAQVQVGAGLSGADNMMRLLRGSTNIMDADFCVRVDTTTGNYTYLIEILDSPGVAVATTYKIQVEAEINEVFVNRRGSPTLTMGQSSITLMEVAS